MSIFIEKSMDNGDHIMPYPKKSTKSEKKYLEFKKRYEERKSPKKPRKSQKKK